MSEKAQEKKRKQTSKTLPKTKTKTRARSTSSRSLASLLINHPTLGMILDDLCRYQPKLVWGSLRSLTSRFVLNCPPEEYSSFDRIGFQVELAHWFYLDFYREEDPSLPNLHLKEFMTHGMGLKRRSAERAAGRSPRN
jgi:hypothetical protein